MQRTPTAWDSNTAKNNGVAYSDAATTYSSSTTGYSSSTTALDEWGKLPAIWTKPSKVATDWQTNPAANTNEYVYDSATDAYDSSTRTYDGVVSGQDDLNQSVPTLWGSL